MDWSIPSFSNPRDIEQINIGYIRELNSVDAEEGQVVTIATGWEFEPTRWQKKQIENYRDKNLDVKSVEYIRPEIENPDGWPEGRLNPVKNILIISATVVGVAILATKLSLWSVLVGVLSLLVVYPVILWVGSSTKKDFKNTVDTVGQSIGGFVSDVTFPVFFPLIIILSIWLWSKS